MQTIKKMIPQKKPESFPKSLRQFFDEILPQMVKKTYLPAKKANVKDRPFSQKDALFFTKGIRELSEAFTENRTQKFFNSKTNYFTHPRFRSSYLLYFLPLHFSKFFLLFDRHLDKKNPLFHQTEPLKILDLGSGPGTASFAFLLWLMENRIKTPLLEVYWCDQNTSILKDGELLLESLQKKFQHFPKVQLIKRTASIQTYLQKQQEKYDFILCGNVLNELGTQESTLNQLLSILTPQSLGVLLIEPANKSTSQTLIQLRSFALLNSPTNEPIKIVGPCLHSEVCPLATGKDWCHFSSPFEIQTQWFSFFSKGLGSIREWLKYSYLWVNNNNKNIKKETPDPELKLVISNPLLPSHGSVKTVLLCDPEKPLRVPLPKNKACFRGDYVLIEST